MPGKPGIFVYREPENVNRALATVISAAFDRKADRTNSERVRPVSRVLLTEPQAAALQHVYKRQAQINRVTERGNKTNYKPGLTWIADTKMDVN
jgi:hypothetical protein